MMAVMLIAAAASAPIDPRYCGAPGRDTAGKIARSAQIVRDFKRVYACPSTGRHSGACPGWAVDHVIPLACGGCDTLGNLQWLPHQIKSASGAFAKDRFERLIYCSQRKD